MVDIYEYAARKFRQEFTLQCEAAQSRKLSLFVSLFLDCVKEIKEEATIFFSQDNLFRLPAVLCHMDLQPQNILFYNFDPPLRSPATPSLVSDLPRIRCVLDWEDAAWADPRFELLLLGRKVCANRDQALIVWEHYAKFLQETNPSMKLGPMEPWLKLGGVHSILTLLLQVGVGGESCVAKRGVG